MWQLSTGKPIFPQCAMKCAASNSLEKFPLMMQAAIFITSATRSTRLPNQPLQKNSEVIQA